ncbi:MAG: T9SS type A sorting domain-containing protein [Bacteroidetes bacterium]|nr:MAG: T9SS type A sorting domain-containing protein [Bacteroidota bacterium]
MEFQGAAVNGQLLFPAGLKKLVASDCNDELELGDLPDSLEEILLYNTNSKYITHIPKFLKRYYQAQAYFQEKSIFPDFRHCVQLKEVEVVALFDKFDMSFQYKLPEEINKLRIFDCNTFMDTIFKLPEHLKSLDIGARHITYFPPELIELKLSCYNECLPEYPVTLQSAAIDFWGKCHPNFVPGMDLQCLYEADQVCGMVGVSNPNNCSSNTNVISGITYRDLNESCIYDANSDIALFGMPVALYDDQGNFLQKRYTNKDGVYSFSVPDGSYRVVLDTNEITLRKSCVNQDHVFDIVFDASNNHASFDVELKCDTLIVAQVDSFDLRLRNLSGGLLRPGIKSVMCATIDDVSYVEQLNCASGWQSETDSLVRVDIKAWGNFDLLTDNLPEYPYFVNGDTVLISYVDSNFQHEPLRHVCFDILVDTTAQIGDWICMEAMITPPAGDINLANNFMEQCFEVVNSYDPNKKDTWPMRVEPGYEDEFRYTIHFQNTGNAEAINVLLVDTLDQQLDLSTFQVIESSHEVLPMLEGHRLLFKFTNINLPDSMSDPQGSQGHVSYKIKPKAAMELNDEIHNTAYIYFDFNEPIITNTSVNLCTIESTSGLTAKERTEALVVYPNPVKGGQQLYVNGLSDQLTEVHVYALSGQVLGTYQLNQQKNTLDFENYRPGIYLLEYAWKGQRITQRVIKL